MENTGENFKLNIEPRADKVGSAGSRRIRKSGKLPVSVYMNKASSINAQVNENEFVKIAERSRATDLFTVVSSDKKLDGLKALVKSIQQEPLKGKVMNIEILALDDKTPIKVRVPIHLEGTPEGVKLQGGVLTHSASNIEVLCLPTKIPHYISVDITSLKVGESLNASDVVLPDGLILKSNPNDTIASVVTIREVKVEETVTAAAEGAAAEGAPAAAAGAAPAAGDKAKAAAPAADKAKK